MFSYLARLSAAFGEAWNRFWFTPSDPLPLCLIRILTGLLILYWQLTLTPDLVRFFGPHGLTPVEAVRQMETPEGARYTLSYFNYLSSPAELWAAHGAGIAVVLAMTLGIFTRATTILSLVVVLSIIHRAPMLTSPFEPVASLVMFYLCIGPSGNCLSLDSVWARRRAKMDLLTPGATRGSTSATIALRLVQVHLAMLYATMGLSKLMGPAWWNGMGMWWLLSRPESRLVDLTGLHAFPRLVELWTHAQVYFELGFPLLIWNRLARPLVLVFAAVMWTLLVLATGQTLFALMITVASLGWLPAESLRHCCPACFGPPSHAR